MNLNRLIIDTLKEAAGCPVEQDVYEGNKEKYITFTYEDERATLRADDGEVADTAYLQISLYAPKDYNYFGDKRKMKKALIDAGFTVESIQTWLEESRNGTKRTRRVIFIVNYTESADIDTDKEQDKED